MPDQSDGDTPLAEPSFHDSSLSWDDTASPDTPPVSESSSPTTDPAITPAAATAQSGQPPTPGAGATPQGPIPYERHQAILEAQRNEADKRWQRVAWADELVQAGATPAEIRDARELYQRARGNTAAFIEDLLQTAGQNPHIAQAVRSIAARALGLQNGNGHQAGAEDDPEPGPDSYTIDANGNRQVFLSLAQHQKWAEWWSRKQDAKLQPLIAKEQQREQQAVKADQERQATDRAKREAADVEKSPYYAQYKPDLVALLQAHDYKIPLKVAWLQVLETKVLPNLPHTVKAQAVAELQTKAHASGIKPGAATASTPKGYTSFKDIPKSEW